MLREVRQELDRIEQFLLRGDQASADLAMLLSALRGPDNESFSYEKMKEKMTSPLRSMMFPKLYIAAENYEGHCEDKTKQKTTKNLWGSFSARYWGMNDPKNFCCPETLCPSHFIRHIRLAYKAITRSERQEGE